VLNENLATVATADALDRGDMDAAGALMSRSHASLRDDYEVTGPALDAMAEAAQASPGCFGARMTGAGFGGSVVALVAADALDEFEREALTRYATSTGTAGSALRVVASRAVSIVG
jgi:galactokinase